ncbi:hypothetical protein JKP88DRAFT_351228 [Tribonema minus]|uniref:Uncharacterized protein n=1 Tax=Tribonema minus TaxID=303371 RepID=A0A835YT28_9STRA|nr:hypothetical protein JKP88DRAFT_351228 [Tribonema minus]
MVAVPPLRCIYSCAHSSGGTASFSSQNILGTVARAHSRCAGSCRVSCQTEGNSDT